MAGMVWERKFEVVLLQEDWGKVPEWECLHLRRKLGFTIGELALPGITFVSVDDVSGLGFEYRNRYDGWRGVLGLGFEALSSGLPTFMGELVRSGQLSEQVFAFYFQKAAFQEFDGELVIGGVDPAHYTGDFFITPLTARDSWSVELTGLK